MDVHVRRAVTNGLRLRGIDVLTAQSDDAWHLTDPELLDRVLETGRVIFTQDDDFLVEAARRLRSGERFPTVLYAHQQRLSVRECIDSLEIFCKVAAREEAFNKVVYLPF